MRCDCIPSKSFVDLIQQKIADWLADDMYYEFLGKKGFVEKLEQALETELKWVFRLWQHKDDVEKGRSRYYLDTVCTYHEKGIKVKSRTLNTRKFLSKKQVSNWLDEYLNDEEVIDETETK